MGITKKLLLVAGLANFLPALCLAAQLDVTHIEQHKVGDLLSAKLGISGLRQPLAVSNKALTPQQIRQHTIHYNINALINTQDAQWGRSYSTALQQNHPGTEYFSATRYADGTIAAAHMVQVPNNFDPNNACIVTAPASGSRGIYGAIGTTAAWALSHRCAIAYTDKGSGTGYSFANLNGQGYNSRGELTANAEQQLVDSQGIKDSFKVKIKHAHDGKDAEPLWGHFVLDSIELALYVLHKFHQPQNHNVDFFANDKVTIIASGVSNGGAAALRAAEIDLQNRIDGVVVNEPNIVLSRKLTTEVAGRKVPVKSLLQRTGELSLFGPCAILALPNTPLADQFKPEPLQEHCELLAKDNYIAKAQPQLAYKKLLELGYNQASLTLLAAATLIELNTSLASGYANAMLRASVDKPTCNTVYLSQQTPGVPAQLSPIQQNQMVTTSSGLPPHRFIGLYQQKDQQYRYLKQHVRAAYNTARCYHDLASSVALVKAEQKRHHQPSANKRPTILLHGDADSVIPIEHSAAVYARLKQQHNNTSFAFYQISNGQHFDAFLKQPAFAQRFVATQPYFEQSLELMWQHITEQKPLPKSQIIDSQPGKEILTIGESS